MRTEAGFIAARSRPRRRRPRSRSKTASASSGPGAPSGWYWTVSIGSSRWRRPSTEPSFRFSWLTRKPPAARQRLGHDLDLVVLGGHLDEAAVDVADGVVGAVVAEAQAARLGAGRPADDLVAEADPEQRPAVGDRRPGEGDRAVQPGRVARSRREDEPVDVGGERIGSSAAVWGRIRTRAPRRRSERTMFALSPRSTIPMSGPPSRGSPTSVISVGETRPTKSWSSQRGSGADRGDGARPGRPRPARSRSPGSSRASAGDGPAPGCRSRRWPGCPTRAAAPPAGGRRRGRRPWRWPRPGPAARAVRTGRRSAGGRGCRSAGRS